VKTTRVKNNIYRARDVRASRSSARTPKETTRRSVYRAAYSCRATKSSANHRQDSQLFSLLKSDKLIG